MISPIIYDNVMFLKAYSHGLVTVSYNEMSSDFYVCGGDEGGRGRDTVI